MLTQRILVVDDDPLIRRQLQDLYNERNYEVDAAACAEDALELLQAGEYALGVFDLKIPGTDGISLTKQVREHWPDLAVVIITGYASIRGAVEAIRQGADDYITKPFEREEILLATAKILEKRKLLDEIDYLRSQLSDRYSFANMVSRNPQMHEMFSMLESLSQNDATVMIHGESGTGKELAARAIHFQGRRKASRFVAINCAAFPDSLLEAELFGYERGAFTGAVADRIGKIELSTGGTLFLDEIESISLPMQLKLLRVLEQREIEKLGGNRVVKVNMRVIAASNRNLQEMVASGEMREDFFYRINVVPIEIPPLRDRIEDVPLLVHEMLKNNPLSRERGISRLSNKALQALMGYWWPGNIRELGNVIERSILRTSGQVIKDVDLPGNANMQASPAMAKSRDYELPLKEYLKRVERDYLSAVLRRNRGGVSATAKHALIDAATLHRKMKAHGLKREDFRTPAGGAAS